MQVFGYTRSASAQMGLGSEAIEERSKRLQEAGCTEIFIDDGVSGTRVGPSLQKALKRMVPGDTLKVCGVQELSRVIPANIVKEIGEQGVNLVVLDFPQVQEWARLRALPEKLEAMFPDEGSDDEAA